MTDPEPPPGTPGEDDLTPAEIEMYRRQRRGRNGYSPVSPGRFHGPEDEVAEPGPPPPGPAGASSARPAPSAPRSGED